MTTRNNKWGNHSKLCASDILFIISIIWNQIMKVIKMTQCTDNKYIYKYIYRWEDKKENRWAVICHFLTCVWSDCLCACPQSTTETLRSNPWRQKDVGVAGKCRVPAKIAQHSTGTIVTKLPYCTVQHNHWRHNPTLIYTTTPLLQHKNAQLWRWLIDIFIKDRFELNCFSNTLSDPLFRSVFQNHYCVGKWVGGRDDKETVFQSGHGRYGKGDQTSAPSSTMQRRSTR